eukprot:GILJ01002026.1.p1 GENE.GILJ01002026.1~~GILJ01002026.1.p1  ORF type:complete len:458 (+),score=50.43 GILJ01002026.1:107-1480(+)
MATKPSSWSPASPSEQLHAPPKILSYAFNQDQTCFACGTETGFRVYNCDPPKETARREETQPGNQGGIAIVAMLFRTNIFALVGGGENPRYPAKKVMIWDDYQNRCIGELRFRFPIKAVLLRRERVVVVLESAIYVYDFADLRVVDHIETGPNPRGLCALCPSSSNLVLACPSPRKGHVHIELYHLQKTHSFQAHESAISCIALDNQGNYLASASENGTLIRIFATLNGQLLHELRRGTDRANICSISFNADCSFLAVSSDKGTVHVFSLTQASSSSTPSNAQTNSNNTSNSPYDLTSDSPLPVRHRSSSSGPYGFSDESSQIPNPNASGEDDSFGKARSGSLAFIKEKAMGYLPKYFSSRWSLAQFHMPPELNTSWASPLAAVRGPIVAFGQEPNTLIIISDNGLEYKCRFDPLQGGECEVLSAHRWLRHDDSANGDRDRADSMRSSESNEDWIML